MIYLKIHDTDNGAMVAICDEKLLGNIYKDKKTGMVLDLKKYADFYKGELVKPENLVDILKRIYIYSGNIVGNEAVSAVIKAGLATGAEVKRIQDVPSLHIYKIL